MNTSPNIFIIVSEYHADITKKLYQGAQSSWHRITQSAKPAPTIWVPGAVEIPITASWIATEHSPDAIVSLGCVIRGETDHFELVCQQVSHGVQHVSLNTQIPIAFGVLTVNNFNQALQRTGGTAGNKGAEAMGAALKMIAVKKMIKEC